MKTLNTFDPAAAAQEIRDFIKTTYQEQGKTTAVIAVSGGIDSAVSLTLLTQALGPEAVRPVFLPYGQQSVADAQEVADFNRIHRDQWHEIDIKPVVDLFALNSEEKIRRGNVMARTRMIYVFDLAKQLNALVCGTENRTEMYLGYFTRFGDEASDLEPLQHLFKTQVRHLAQHLGLPEVIQTKAPSAGLWQDQTDEQELGFTYTLADQVLLEYEQQGGDRTATEESLSGVVASSEVTKVLDLVEKMQFKHVVPYTVTNSKN